MGPNFAEPPPGSNRSAETAASIVTDAYRSWQDGFQELTGRAPSRFECRDWRGAQADAQERLQLYKICQDTALDTLRERLGPALQDAAVWTEARVAYSSLEPDRPDRELAETFFNSVSRRVLSTVGVNGGIEYTESSERLPAELPMAAICRQYAVDDIDTDVVRRVLQAIPWTVPYAQLERDVAVVAELIDTHVRHTLGVDSALVFEIVSSMFFRNKGAYIVGRIRAGERIIPLVLPLLHAERGIVVDAVLMTEQEVSVVFGFSWSYFRVEAPYPRALVAFLQSIMPFKRVDELYNAIGYNKHGKTELYRMLMGHLAEPDAKFAFAEGDEGLVMAVFTLPALNVVFKLIKDRFAAPKNTTHQRVKDKYHFVFIRDRVGRLADAQEFLQLEFPKRCFPADLLRYLLDVASHTVRIDGDRVIVRHLYTERRVVPLNVFLRDADEETARIAVLEFGDAIKDLAAADIFAGDMLLKNFGVSRHGRVICYDYDELCLLTECRFRRIPAPRSPEDELAAEPWFAVGEHDVFPEEFATFLVPSGRAKEAFLSAHADLLQPAYWQAVQTALEAGTIFDVFPYRRDPRLQRPHERYP